MIPKIATGPPSVDSNLDRLTDGPSLSPQTLARQCSAYRFLKANFPLFVYEEFAACRNRGADAVVPLDNPHRLMVGCEFLGPQGIAGGNLLLIRAGMENETSATAALPSFTAELDPRAQREKRLAREMSGQDRAPTGFQERWRISVNRANAEFSRVPPQN